MSRVVVLDLSRHNAVLVGHEQYFVLETGGRRELVLDRCPHRGGPLSLARLTPDSRRLTCPWHGTSVTTSAVRRTAVPMIRSGEHAVAVFPDLPAEVPITVIRRRILANLPPATEPVEAVEAVGAVGAVGAVEATEPDTHTAPAEPAGGSDP